jgi:hypothetical protein
MLAPRGITEADDLHPLTLLENRVIAATYCHVCACGPDELRRGRGATGGEEEERDGGFHRLRVAPLG